MLLHDDLDKDDCPIKLRNPSIVPKKLKEAAEACFEVGGRVVKAAAHTNRNMWFSGLFPKGQSTRLFKKARKDVELALGEHLVGDEAEASLDEWANEMTAQLITAVFLEKKKRAWPPGELVERHAQAMQRAAHQSGFVLGSVGSTTLTPQTLGRGCGEVIFSGCPPFA